MRDECVMMSDKGVMSDEVMTTDAVVKMNDEGVMSDEVAVKA